MFCTSAVFPAAFAEEALPAAFPSADEVSEAFARTAFFAVTSIPSFTVIFRMKVRKSALSETISAMISFAMERAVWTSGTSFSGSTYFLASVSAGTAASDRMYSARPRSPFSRAIIALVLRFGR